MTKHARLSFSLFLSWPLKLTRPTTTFVVTMVIRRSRKGTGFPPQAIETLAPGEAIEGGVVEAVVTLALKASESRLVSYAASSPNVTEFAIVLDRDDAVWRYVGDSPLARPAVGATTAAAASPPSLATAGAARQVYQLITSSHILVVDGAVYADYDGVEDSVAIRSGYAANLAALNRRRDFR